MSTRKLNVIVHPICDVDLRVMPPKTVRVLLEQIFALTYLDSEITFSFRGTEPTLAGVEFYRYFVKLAQQMQPSGCHLFWSIRTRDMDLNDAWTDLFIQHDFEISVAVDGVRSPRDGAWPKTRSAFRSLVRRDASVTALYTLSGQSTRRPEVLYQSLRRLGAKNITFCPSVGDGTDEALTPPQLANFVCRVFDIWYDEWKNGSYCFVNLFDNYIRILRGLDCTECAVQGRCGSTVLVKADGNIYPCEKYKSDDDRLGTIGEGGIKEALRSPLYQRWLQSGNQKPKECLNCNRSTLCNGGCKGDWVAAEDGMHNPYCSAYKRFFLYAYPRLIQIARETKDT